MTGSIFTYRPIPERKDHLDIAGIEPGPPAWQETALSITPWNDAKRESHNRTFLTNSDPPVKEFFCEAWTKVRRWKARGRSFVAPQPPPLPIRPISTFCHCFNRSFQFSSFRFGQFYKNQDDAWLVVLLHMMQPNEKYFIDLMPKHHNLIVVFLTHKSTLWARVVITSLRILSHGSQPIKALERLDIACSVYLDHEWASFRSWNNTRIYTLPL